MSAGLLQDVRSTPVEGVPGRTRFELTDDWSFLYPSGGVLMSAALQAMTAALGRPDQRLLSATATFCAPVAAGPLNIDTRILRTGRAASQVEARLGPGEDPADGLTCTAVFAVDREGPEVRGSPPPDLPHWRDCEAWPRGRVAFPFFERFEDRRALGRTWSEKEWTPTVPRSARWLRYLVPPRGPDGTLDPVALPPIVDLMPGALFQALGPDTPRFFAPSLDLTLHVLEPTPRDWLLCAAYGRRARRGFASCEMEVWDEDGRLAAYATQTMMIRQVKGRR